MNRQQFEKLPEIALILKRYVVSFNGCRYELKSNSDKEKSIYALGFLNGAWMVYQEQQRKNDFLIQQVSISDFKDELGHSLKNNLAYVEILK